MTPIAGAATELRANDVVVAVEGREIDTWLRSVFDATATPLSRVEGAEVAFTVERDGERMVLPVELRSLPVVAILADSWAVLVLVTVLFLVGVSVFARRPAEPAGRALFVIGTAILGSTVVWLLGIGVTDVIGGTAMWLYLAAAGVVYTLFWAGLVHFGLVFPAPMPLVVRHPWLIAAAYGLPFGVQLLAVSVGLVSSDRPTHWAAAWLSSVLLMQAGAVLLAMAVLVVNYRQSDATDRGRLRWIALAATLGAAGGLAFWTLPELFIGDPLLPWNAVALIGLPFPLAVAAAIHRHRLFEMDALFNRSLVYGSLSLLVILVYAAGVAILGSLLPTDAPYAVTLLAIGAAALAVLPLRDRLQRGVNRLMYGDRDDPYRAIARLAEQLEASLDPRAVLPTVVATVAQALRLPYAAISLDSAGGPRLAAVHGEPRHGRQLRLPLVHHGETVGELVLAPRLTEETFSPADQRLLTGLARQAGAAAYAVRLTDELQRSRERLVIALEEERRVLRRDLHDELGPTLAGSLLKMQAARSLLDRDPAAAGRILGELGAETHRAIDEIRRLARDLRPPALDELGLVGALHEQASRLTTGDLEVVIETPDELPSLPAAVEVAAFRIAVEALTNVARHARARRAWLRLALEDGRLVVEVADDGSGVAPLPNAGVGWTSMRERASELGGVLEIGPAPAGGTRVRAGLPLPPRPSS